MKARLCLSLTQNANIRLELLEDDLETLDQTIMNKYENSEAIRKEFSTIINQFLTENSDLRNKSKIENNGKIILIGISNDNKILVDKDYNVLQFKVYYRSDKPFHTKERMYSEVRNEILSNKKFLKNAYQKYPNMFTSYEKDQLKYNNIDNFSKTRYHDFAIAIASSLKDKYYYLRSLYRLKEKKEEDLLAKYKDDLKPVKPQNMELNKGHLKVYPGFNPSKASLKFLGNEALAKEADFPNISNNDEELYNTYSLDELTKTNHKK